MTQQEFSDKVVGMSARIFRFALRLTGDGPTAEDVMQDVLEKMWNRRGTLDGCANIESFVMLSTRNCCYDLARRKQVARVHGERIARESEKQEAHTPMESEQTAALVREAIASLPEKQREAIHLRDIEGYEFDRIGEIMECDPATARVYLSRARKAVGEILKKQRGAL